MKWNTITGNLDNATVQYILLWKTWRMEMHFDFLSRRNALWCMRPWAHVVRIMALWWDGKFFRTNVTISLDLAQAEEMEVQEILMVATLAVFNVCWGVMASLPVRTIILNCLSPMDCCLSFIIKVSGTLVPNWGLWKRCYRLPNQPRYYEWRMTKRISTSSGHHVPGTLLHILSCPHLGQQVGATISCL